MSDELVQSIEETRQFLAEELPVFTRTMVDTALAEGTTVAMAKVYEMMLKSVPGLAVVEKKDPYANLPTINFTIGPGMQVTMTPGPATDDVIDVVPKEGTNVPELGTPEPEAQLPDDPLELLTLDLDAVPLGGA